MINLPSVTVFIADTKNHAGAIRAIQATLKIIKPARTVFLTDMDITVPNVEVIKIEPITSKREYSRICIKEMYKYFDTEYVMVIQWDGYPCWPEAWDEDFLSIDYIGAPFDYDHERQVGNGGFSIRSKRLQTILAEDPWIDVVHPEDQSICILYRFYLEEKYNIKFASRELADGFSFECVAPPRKTLGFHNFDALPHAYRPTVVVKRTASLGDVISAEPLMAKLHEQGFRIFLDTIRDFFFLFLQHKYPIEHISNMPPNLSHSLIDLDMSYENNPKQLHLKSYFEAAGMADEELKSPRLYFNITESNKLFKKYCVLHIDKRDTKQGRNANADWQSVVSHVKDMGYDVIQIGEGESVDVKGAIRMKAATLNLLMYIIAGADLFVGVDSGPSHIAAAFDIPSVLFFGSVNPDYIHPSNYKKVYLHNHDRRVCRQAFCWHETQGCEGTPCVENPDDPPCTHFTVMQVIDAVKKVLQ